MDKRENRDKIKVAVHLFSGRTVWGYVFLKEGERLQDLVNDERMFIPLSKYIEGREEFDEPSTEMINKRAIERIEDR